MKKRCGRSSEIEAHVKEETKVADSTPTTRFDIIGPGRQLIRPSRSSFEMWNIFRLFFAILALNCSPSSALKHSIRRTALVNGRSSSFAQLRAKSDGTGECPFSTPLGKIGSAGIISNIVCDYSLYVLKTTGSGLPAGFFGLEGAAEGVSYLVVAGVFGWSLVKKISTGSGLDAGPLGLLGAAEGLSFLT